MNEDINNNDHMLTRQFTYKPEDFSFDNIVYILNLSTLQRSSKQMHLLREFTKSIKFFEDLTKENGKIIHYSACERLFYEFVPMGNFVFQYKSPGNKFYIILKGKVSVLVPRVLDIETELTKVAVIDAGGSFGELALINDQPRSASIYCEEDTHFATLSKEDYIRILGKLESRKLDRFISFLYSIPIFRKWTKKKLQGLSLYMNKKYFLRKQEVFRINSEANYVYIVQEGEFELTKYFKNTPNKHSYTIKLAILTKGEVFGHAEVLKKIPYSYTCVCYSSSGILLGIKAEDFHFKVYSQEFISEFKKNEYSKHMLRSFKIESFRQYLDSEQGKDSGKKIFFNRNLGSTPSPRKISTPTLGRSEGKDVFLNADTIRRIKKKALGRMADDKVSVVTLRDREGILKITTNFNGSEMNCKQLTSTSEGTRSSLRSTMKHHRPGGYFQGKFKKSWKGLKVLST